MTNIYTQLEVKTRTFKHLKLEIMLETALFSDDVVMFNFEDIYRLWHRDLLETNAIRRDLAKYMNDDNKIRFVDMNIIGTTKHKTEMFVNKDVLFEALDKYGCSSITITRIDHSKYIDLVKAWIERLSMNAKERILDKYKKKEIYDQEILKYPLRRLTKEEFYLYARHEMKSLMEWFSSISEKRQESIYDKINTYIYSSEGEQEFVSNILMYHLDDDNASKEEEFFYEYINLYEYVFGRLLVPDNTKVTEEEGLIYPKWYTDCYWLSDDQLNCYPDLEKIIDANIIQINQ